MKLYDWEDEEFEDAFIEILVGTMVKPLYESEDE